MNADAFFTIGKAHKVCQDYARAGIAQGNPYAILADGCSSSPDTDIGARIMVQVAESCILQDKAVWSTWAQARTVSAAESMGVPLESLDATLLTARWTPLFNSFLVDVAGDGVVAARKRDGSGFDLYIFEYPSGAPYYLSYSLNPSRDARYLQEFGGSMISRRYGEDGTVPEIIHARDSRPSFLVSPANHDLLLLMSDGVQSFQKMVGTETSLVPEKVPVRNVVTRLLDVKATRGEFIVRRCQRFLGRFCARNGWFHTDDFSVAAIWMGDSE